MINFLKRYWILIAIFLFFAFLRFYNLDQRIGFDWDQEQFSYQVKNIVERGDFTLLGPRANNDRGFFLGPYFTYLLVPFYLITYLHPNATLVFIVIYNLLFFYLSFKILKKIFSLKIALLFLFLWSTNYLILNYDTVAWWPILIPLGAMLLLSNLYQIFKNPSFKNYLIMGLILGFFYNMHFQFIFMILFSLVFIFFNLKKKNFISIKKMVTLLTGFIITFTPLIIFDLRNNFLNIRLFFSFFFSSEPSVGREMLAWLPVFTNVVHPFIYIKNNFLMTLFYFSILAIVIYLIKKNTDFKNTFYKSFLILWLITPIFFSFYGKRPSEYYFLYLYPFLIIAITDFLLKLKNKVFILIILFYISIINYSNLINQLASNKIGLKVKDKTIQTLKANIDETKKYNVTIDAPLGFHNGYKYLLDWYKIPQSGNFTDPLIQIKLPPEKVDIRVNDGIGLIIPKEVRKK